MAVIVTASKNSTRIPRSASDALRTTSVLCFTIVALCGASFFVYMLGFYGRTLLGGEIHRWNERLFKGILEGDPWGNIMIAVHLATAASLSIGGPIQLIDRIRVRYPMIHRVNGWIYIFSAISASGAGLYLLVARGGVSVTGDVSLGLNGALILVFSGFATSDAIRRRFADHRRWALRLFLAINGFLFARFGFRAWIFLTGGIGHTSKFDGWFDVGWGFASYLAPLAGLELFFIAQRQDREGLKWGLALSMLAGASFLVLGAALTIGFDWIPKIVN